MGKRQEAAGRTRQRIIDAVKGLARGKSLGEITVDEVVEAAGVAKGTFYVYFKRKEDVFAELAYERFDDAGERLAGSGLAAGERLGRYLDEAVAFVEDCGLEMTQQWFRACVAPAGGELVGQRRLDIDLGFVRGCLEDAGAADAEARARQVVAALYGAIVLWCMTDGAIPIRDAMDLPEGATWR